MIQHKESARLTTRLQKIVPHATGWAGVGYRSVSTRYARSSDILTGIGSKLAGGRWNPLRSFPTVYLSLEPGTAFAETFSSVRYYGFEPQDALPRTFVALDVKLHRILDLSDPVLLKRLRITRRSILHVDWRACQDAGREALTQAIGRVANEVGYEGLLAPSSAAPGGVNLIYFPEALLPESKVDLLNPDKLKPLR